MDSPFIPLGSGYSLPWDVHPSLALLHQLKLFNFPIPKGIILIKPTTVGNSLELELRNRDISYPIEVFFFNRASPTPLSKVFESFTELRTAVESTQASDLDILVCEKPLCRIQGTALSQKGFLDDWITFCLLTEKGLFPENQMPIEKLAAGEKRLGGDFRGRLQEILRAIRNALGEDNWQVSWSDDGENIFLHSIHSETKFDLIVDHFSQISVFENTPQSPSVLEGSLIGLCSSKLFQFYGHWAPELSPNRTWVYQAQDKLLFNESLLEDFLRTFGFSTQVLGILNAGLQKSTIPTNSIRFWRNLPRLIRLIHHLSLSPGIANRLTLKLRNFDTSPEKKMRELFLEWQNIYTSTSHCIYRIWAFYFFCGGLLRFLGLPSNLFQLPSDILPSWVRWILYPLLRFGEKLNLAESMLREASSLALSKIYSCIEMKSLGWFARGLLTSSESIWTLDSESALKLDTPPMESV